MIFGSHNSLTGHKLIWWQRPFSWFINLLSRCQDKTIDLQLESGVRWFNLQVNQYNGRWIGSHGIAWYDIDLFEVLNTLNDYPDKIYVQLYLDKHFFHNTEVHKFEALWSVVKTLYKNIIWQSVWNEDTKLYLHKSKAPGKEKYWTMSKAKWWLKIPIPRLWKKDEGYEDYLMIDFV